MNAAQLRKYRAEWGKARQWLRANGRTAQQADAMRHTIHRQKLGRDKSSLALTNDEFTRVLAGFRAVYDGGNLDAQLQANDDPERRVADLRAGIVALAARCGITGGLAGVEAYFRTWLQGRTIAALTERELQQLRGILDRRLAQLPDGDNPF